MVLNDTLIQNGITLLTNDSINLTGNVIAENLTDKLVTDFFIWSNVLPIISIIIAFFSIIIAIISIYLSQYQGAKIKLVEKPKIIELDELKIEEFDNGYIPSTLPIKKLDLFFVNSGNRDGILKDVHASILLEENAKLYLKGIESINVKYSNNSENNDFLIILDKSVGHIFIENLYLKAIDLKKGHTFAKFNLVKENTNLVEIINNIFDIQRTDLNDFIEFIEKNHTFGNLEISYKHTGRNYLLQDEIIPDKLDLKIERKFIGTVEGYQQLLNNWNDLSPTNEEVISNLIEFLDYRCKPMIEQNREALENMPVNEKSPFDGTLPIESYINLLESFSFEYNLLKKWETSKLFSEKLSDLIKEMKDYIKIYNKSRTNSTLHEDWKQSRMNLLNKCIEVYNQTVVIKDDLKSISKEQNKTKK